MIRNIICWNNKNKYYTLEVHTKGMELFRAFIFFL